MSITIALAIGFDPWLLESQRTALRSAGCFVTGAGSVGEAMAQLKSGDFDLVLLGHSIPLTNREEVTSLVRGVGSLIPVVCITDPAINSDDIASLRIENQPSSLLQRIAGLLAIQRRERPPELLKIANPECKYS
jgi:DNA-binding response OmpR family regulator